MEGKYPTKIEQIVLADTGVAVGSRDKTGVFRHSTEDYVVLSDDYDTEGNRIIKLARRDMSGYNSQIKEIVRMVSNQLGEVGKPFKQLLTDVLKEEWPESIQDIYDKLRSGMPAKAKEGCFKLVIGDGRAKDSREIMLRD